MELIPIIDVSLEEWSLLYKEYGNAQIPPLGNGEKLDASDYPNHVIVRGKMKLSGSDSIIPTNTGYLRTGVNYIGSVQL